MGSVTGSQLRRSDHAIRLLPEARFRCISLCFSYGRTRHGGKDDIGIRTDQPHGTHNDHEDDGEHHGIVNDILALFMVSKISGDAGLRWKFSTREMATYSGGPISSRP